MNFSVHDIIVSLQRLRYFTCLCVLRGGEERISDRRCGCCGQEVFCKCALVECQTASNATCLGAILTSNLTALFADAYRFRRRVFGDGLQGTQIAFRASWKIEHSLLNAIIVGRVITICWSCTAPLAVRSVRCLWLTNVCLRML